MTYAVGGTIQANDYNGFVGTTAVNQAYANDTAAQNKIAALIGVGYGTRGYGQTATTLASVVAGNTVTAVQWNNLRSAMSTINTQTNSALTLQPAVVAGGQILAEDGTSGRPNISSLIGTLDTNRLTANITQMSVTSALTSSRSTAWSGTISHVFTVAFASEDAARYYFNSGGEIRFHGSNVGGTTGAAAAWAALLSAMGTIKMGATTTTYTGTGGTITNNIGYYGLTAAYQEIFIHYGSGPYYSGIYYDIQVRRENYVGANGGNGSLIRVTVNFNDHGAVYAYSTINGTTTSAIDQYKAAGVLTIASPTFTTITGL